MSTVGRTKRGERRRRFVLKRGEVGDVSSGDNCPSIQSIFLDKGGETWRRQNDWGASPSGLGVTGVRVRVLDGLGGGKGGRPVLFPFLFFLSL